MEGAEQTGYRKECRQEPEPQGPAAYQLYAKKRRSPEQSARDRLLGRLSPRSCYRPSESVII